MFHKFFSSFSNFSYICKLFLHFSTQLPFSVENRWEKIVKRGGKLEKMKCIKNLQKYISILYTGEQFSDFSFPFIAYRKTCNRNPGVYFSTLPRGVSIRGILLVPI